MAINKNRKTSKKDESVKPVIEHQKPVDPVEPVVKTEKAKTPTPNLGGPVGNQETASAIMDELTKDQPEAQEEPKSTPEPVTSTAHTEQQQTKTETPKSKSKSQERDMSTIKNKLFKKAQRTSSGLNIDSNVALFVEGLEKVAEEMKSGFDVTLINEPGILSIPVVVLSKRYGNCTNYVSLLIESCAKPVKPRIVTVGSIPYNLPFVTAQFCDKKLLSTVKQTLLSLSNGGTVDDITTMVVGRDCDISETGTIQAFYDAAMMAITSRGEDAYLLTSSDLLAEEYKLVTETKINPGATVAGPFGEPIASDVTIETRAVEDIAGNKPTDVHGEQGVLTLSKVNAVLDFTYIGEADTMALAMRDPTKLNPSYAMSLVITSCTGLSDGENRYENTSTQIIGLMSCAPILNRYQYLNILTPSPMSYKSSIGNLSIESSPQAGVPPKGKAEKITANIHAAAKGEYTAPQMVNAFCSPGIALAIDVKLGGGQEWMQSDFIRASAPGEKEANARLISEIDRLLGGKFAPVWGDRPIMSQGAMTTVVLADVVDESGNACSTSSFDYLRLLELKGTDAATMALLSIEPGKDNEVCLAQRLAAYENTIPGLQNIAYGKRCYFDPELLNAMLTAAQSCGIKFESADFGETNIYETRGTMVNRAMFGVNVNAGMAFQPAAAPGQTMYGAPQNGYYR